MVATQLLHCQNTSSSQKYKFCHVVSMTFLPVNTPRLNGKTIRESLVLTPWNQVTWQPGPIKTWIPGGTDFWWPDLVYFVFLVFFVRFFALFFLFLSKKFWSNTTISLHGTLLRHVAPEVLGFLRDYVQWVYQ